MSPRLQSHTVPSVTQVTIAYSAQCHPASTYSARCHPGYNHIQQCHPAITYSTLYHPGYNHIQQCHPAITYSALSPRLQSHTAVSPCNHIQCCHPGYNHIQQCHPTITYPDTVPSVTQVTTTHSSVTLQSHSAMSSLQLQRSKQNVWPTSVQLHTKLYGSREELEKMDTFTL